ncbi:hypothetical protein Pan216_48220 [Planctomycetes bacterium Pan216]|uniref:Uncharacterized protein n=1 Tax=Kolteria novifilia TaxID=2527975 RepID=A0A518BAD3_9BACT|nr:hypothetical protein Pan216_48220 [Planctomycetes bacterium Pan216]
MIHELKVDLDDNKGVRHQANLRSSKTGFNGSIQLRFSPRERFTVSCLGRQNTVIIHTGERQIALPLDELTRLVAREFGQEDDAAPTTNPSST